jgi:hypothetical protein
MKRILFTILFTNLATVSSLPQGIKSPGDFLGYELGTQFTLHHKAIDYCKYVAENSPSVEYREYGRSWEGRPLCVCIISSEENLKNIEELRRNNLVKTGLMKGEFTGKQIPFIWMGYNIHGNEAAGMEAAMKTLYTLVSGSYNGAEEWLKSCIIIIDPCQNPDGRDLYAHRYTSSRNNFLNPDRNSWEHNQAWPSARMNHYLFDLNRDWTWQTQVETRQRIKLYNQFMPHVFADFHEMGAESTFFFAPGAKPWHEVITPWQHEFLALLGKGNAELFDEKSRLYFTKENYDLFCPSFGDTWPLFNGAMGFTIEQGGGGASGLAYKKESGDTLTLKERIDGHFTSAMATIKVSYENRNKLISGFNKYFDENVNKPSFQYKSVIIKGSNERSNMENLFRLLDNNQIRYSLAGNSGKKFKAFDFLANKEDEMTIEKGDVLISSSQPLSRLVQVLFEPDSKASDSLSYDLTAWSLPYAYNLKAYALAEQIKPEKDGVEIKAIINEPDTSKPYAYTVNFTGFNETKFIAALLKKNVKPRYSLKPFTINGISHNRGSLIIARGDNKQLEAGFDKIITEEANRCQVKLIPSETGLVESGKDFGSVYSSLMKKKSVALLCGEGTSTGSVGELWYFFEQELDYPVTLINTGIAEQIDFSKYDVLLLTSGGYSKLKDTIVDYVKKGGRVVAFENAISVFAAEKSTSLSKAVETRSAEQKAVDKKEKSDDPSLLRKFEDQRRHPLTERSAGSIYRIKLDETHPFVFGLGSEWFVLKRSTLYPFLTTGSNIGYILDKEPIAGFAGYKFKDKVKNTLFTGSEKIGSGEVVYITDNPYFRAFWKSGRVILGNAVFR